MLSLNNTIDAYTSHRLHERRSAPPIRATANHITPNNPARTIKHPPILVSVSTSTEQSPEMVDASTDTHELEKLIQEAQAMRRIKQLQEERIAKAAEMAAVLGPPPQSQEPEDE